jgi:hypothetical protein
MPRQNYLPCQSRHFSVGEDPSVVRPSPDQAVRRSFSETLAQWSASSRNLRRKSSPRSVRAANTRQSRRNGAQLWRVATCDPSQCNASRSSAGSSAGCRIKTYKEPRLAVMRAHADGNERAVGIARRQPAGGRILTEERRRVAAGTAIGCHQHLAHLALCLA